MEDSRKGCSSASPPGNPNPNPNPNPAMRATSSHYFLSALAHIAQTRASKPYSSSSSSSWLLRRSRRISRAAYASMALAAGPRRTWSRALLRRLRVRSRGARVLFFQRRRRAPPVVPGSRRADTLRRLLPGGQGMELCCLLEETADYIRCLGNQVRIMQSIVDATASPYN